MQAPRTLRARHRAAGPRGGVLAAIMLLRAGCAAGGGTITVATSTVERWSYERGSRSFSMIVTITDGAITALERGE